MFTFIAVKLKCFDGIYQFFKFRVSVRFAALDMSIMPVELMTQDDAVVALLAYAFSGAIGSAKGKGVTYVLLSNTPTIFAWSVALEDEDVDPAPIDRYLVKIDRQSKKILPPEPIVLTKTELAEAIFAATGQRLASSSRFTDGLLSISYKVTVQHPPDVAYVVQLRHHGRVASMDFFNRLVSRTVDPGILPVPSVYPIPGEMERQEATGRGRQISRFIPGDMASAVYPRLSHEERLVLVKKMALAFQACWQIQLPQLHLIGELLGDDTNGLRIGPDRHYNLGGPFNSVREYLRAHIRSSFTALEKQDGVDEYKAKYLGRIGEFLDRHEYDIPAIVEDIPIVAMHSDMGLHNIILSSQTPTDIRAIIDWEFVASAPYASLYRIIEMLFRKPAPNRFGPEFERANELREAFWNAIPYWKRWNDSEATKTFLEWFRFGLFMHPQPRPDDLAKEEKDDFWQENIGVVEGILGRY